MRAFMYSSLPEVEHATRKDEGMKAFFIGM